MIDVKGSSNVQKIGYDIITRFLYIAYLPTKKDKDGPLYRYKDVPAGVGKRLLQAPSKGMFIHTHIKNKYGYAKWSGSGWRKETALKRGYAAEKRRKDQSK